MISEAEARRQCQAIADGYGLTWDELMGPQKFRMFVAARRECFQLLSDRGWSSDRIGRFFRRDGSVIRHAIKIKQERAR